MNSLLMLALQCCVAALVCAAPVHLPDDADFEQTLENAQSLVKKMLGDILSVQKDLTQDPSGHTGDLQLILKTLGIPPAPTFKPISAHFTLDVCLQRMSLGLQLHHSLLGALTPASTSTIKVLQADVLQADLRDLQLLVKKMQKQSQLSVLPSEEQGFTLNISGTYEVQVATHLALQQLRNFSHDLGRSLRNIQASLPGTLG